MGTDFGNTALEKLQVTFLRHAVITPCSRVRALSFSSQLLGRLLWIRGKPRLLGLPGSVLLVDKGRKGTCSIKGC